MKSEALPVWFPVLLLFLSLESPAQGESPGGFRQDCAALYHRLSNPLLSQAEIIAEKPLARTLYQFALDPQPRFPERTGNGFVDKGFQVLKAHGKMLARVLNPLPSLSRADNELEAIFARLWKNPSYRLSEAERKLLGERKLLEFFADRKKYLLANPHISRLRALPGLARNAFVTVSAATALNQAYQMSKNTTSFPEFLEGPMEEENGAPIVQMFVETTPFPHTALRIGRKVYSYGQEYMTSRSLFEYLSMPPESPPLDPARSENVLPNLAAGIGKDVSRGVGKRSLRVTTLHLPPQTVARLQRDLEMNTGKVYANHTGVNDCTTMVKRALEESNAIVIPWDVDASPTAASTYLSLRHSLGDKRVGETQLLLPSKEDSKGMHIARNAYTAMVESNVLFDFFPLFVAKRAAFEAKTGKEELQHYIPEIQGEIDEWKRQARADARAEMHEYFDEGRFFSTIGRVRDPRKRVERIRAAREQVEHAARDILERSETSLDYSGTEMDEVITAAEKKLTVEELRADLLSRMQALLPQGKLPLATSPASRR